MKPLWIIFRHYLEQIFVVFIDDILIYSQLLQEHEEHLKIVLEVFRENK